MKLKFNFYLGWLGGRKAKGSIDVAQVVKLLHSNGATADVLQVFLNLVDPLEERENIAKKFGVHTIVVDVCVLNRDRIALGKKHALKKYDQFNLNTSCFLGSTESNITPVMQFHEIFVTKIMDELIYYYYC